MIHTALRNTQSDLRWHGEAALFISAIAVTSMQLAASAHGQRATNYSTNYGANRSAGVTNVGMALLCVFSTLLQVHGYRLSCAPKRLRTLPRTPQEESASKWQPSPRQRLPMDQPEPEETSIKPTGSIILDDGSIGDGRDKTVVFRKFRKKKRS
jgi:hypothetical protein